MLATGLLETAANSTTQAVGFNLHLTYYPILQPARTMAYHQMLPHAPFNPHTAYYPVSPARPDNGLQVRCLSCKKFYLPSQNSPQACKHHKGKFEEPPAWQGGGAGGLNLAWMTKKWNCCSDIAQSSEGCCVGWHIEDVATTQILSKFEQAPNASATRPTLPPVQPSSPANNPTLVNSWLTTGSYAAAAAPPSQQQPPNAFINRQKQQEIEEKEKRELEEEKEFQKRGYFKHHVQTTDTLQGVSLRYGVPVDDIKKVNKLFNASSLISRRYIYVKTSKDITALPPPIELSEEHRKRSMVSKFISIGHDSSKEEARAYLETNHWDLNAALLEYGADRAWESAGMLRK